MRTSTSAFAFTILLLAAPLAGLLSVGSQTAEGAKASLPTRLNLPLPHGSGTAVWDGQNVYLLGGHGCLAFPCDDVIRVNVSSNAATVMRTKLAVDGPLAAGWDGKAVYVFGGRQCSTVNWSCWGSGAVYRFDARNDTVRRMNATVSPWHSQAIWTGTSFLLVGDGQVQSYRPDLDAVTTLGSLHVYPWGATWNGDHALLFTSASVVRYWPSNGTTQTLVNFAHRNSFAVAPVGGDVLLLGGHSTSSCPWETSGRCTEILVFNVSTNQVRQPGLHLPTAVSYPSAVGAGAQAYVFGGYAPWGPTTQVVRVTPATRDVKSLAATLPAPRDQPQAVWDGRHVVLYGSGCDQAYVPSCFSLLRYTPATDNLTVTRTSLPRHGVAAAAHGGHVYFLGGSGCSQFASHCDDVLRYNATSDTLTKMRGRLPALLNGGAAASDGRHVYVFGGCTTWFCGRQIVRYDPATDSTKVMGARAPYAPAWGDQRMKAVPAGDVVYLVTAHEVHRYDPAEDTVRLVYRANQDDGPYVHLSSLSPVWNGRNLLFLGQANCRNSGCEIGLELNLTTLQVRGLGNPLPLGRGGATAVWDGTGVWLLGGYSVRFDPPFWWSTRTTEITRIDAARLVPSTSLPDLLVADVQPLPGVPAPGEDVSFRATLRNVGRANAGAFTVRFFVDGDLHLGDVQVSGLARGAWTNVTSATWRAPGGTHNLNVQVDAMDTIREGSEWNNYAHRSLHVYSASGAEASTAAPVPPPRGDLAPGGLKAIEAGDGRVALVVEVRNLGPGPVVATDLALTAGGTLVCRAPVASLGPGQSAHVACLVQGDRPAQVEVRVDDAGRVAEAEEANNVAVFPVPAAASR